MDYLGGKIKYPTDVNSKAKYSLYLLILRSVDGFDNVWASVYPFEVLLIAQHIQSKIALCSD